MLIRTSKDKDHPYVILNKSFFEDPNLSLKAKGLLAYCMCKPDGWQFHIEQLTTVLKEGKDAIYSGFKELIDRGYCLRENIRNNDGKFIKSDYTLFETPNNQHSHDNNHPLRENPDTDNPDTENPPLVINDSSNNDLSNIDVSVKKKSPKKKTKTPLITWINHEEPELRIETSQEDHQKLIDKYGQVFTLQCYEYLQAWKISKWEADPKSFPKHTDYYRIIHWAANALKKDEKKPSASTKDYVETRFKHGGIYNGAECFINEEAIAFQRGINYVNVKFKDFGFKEQFENMLRKFQIL